MKKAETLSFYVNTNLVTMSDGMSSYLQVFYVIANKLFIDQPYRPWPLFGNFHLTPIGDIRPSEVLCRKLVKTAWNDVSPEFIVNTV